MSWLFAFTVIRTTLYVILVFMYLAVDIGGTKTLLASFNEAGSLQQQLKFPTPRVYEEFLTTLEKSVSELDADDFTMACIAIPGKVNREHGIGLAFGNLPWESVPIQADFEKIIKCPVLLENDANLAGLSEAMLIKDEFKKVLYVTISTGIGGGIIINGMIDPNFEDSEVGHILLEHDGKLQLWEEFASGRAIKNKYGKLVSDIAADDKIWYVIARNIAIGLIDLIATITPEIIILGGGVGAHLDKFQNRLMEELKIYEMPLVPIPVIRQAKRSEEAVIYGCFELMRTTRASR